MKTSLKRWLSWTLAFMMVFSSTGLVFAEPQQATTEQFNAKVHSANEVSIHDADFRASQTWDYKWELQHEGQLDFYDVPHYRVTVKPAGVDKEKRVMGSVLVKNETDKALLGVVVSVVLTKDTKKSVVKTQLVDVPANDAREVEFSFDVANLLNYNTFEASLSNGSEFIGQINIGQWDAFNEEVEVKVDGYTFDPPFVVKRDATEVSRLYQLEAITEKTTKTAIIELGHEEKLSAEVTLDPNDYYGVAAQFYIRNDNSIVTENGYTQYPNRQYWPDHPGIKGSIKKNRDVWNDYEAVIENLAEKPTAAQLKYNPETHTPVWYVVKDVKNGSGVEWHVDGIIVEKDGLSIRYLDDTAENPAQKFLAETFYTIHKKAIIGKVTPNSVYEDGVVVPKKSGYAFNQWNTAPDGTGTEYTNGQEIKDLDESLVLYAQWTPVDYKVIFKANGGKNIPDNLTGKHLNEEITVPNQRPIREGYVFGGWRADVDLNGDGKANDVYQPLNEFTMPAGDVTLTAIWNNFFISGDDTYKVWIDVDNLDDSGSDIEPTFKADEKFAPANYNSLNAYSYAPQFKDDSVVAIEVEDTGMNIAGLKAMYNLDDGYRTTGQDWYYYVPKVKTDGDGNVILDEEVKDADGNWWYEVDYVDSGWQKHLRPRPLKRCLYPLPPVPPF